jgi:hypothetical protein
LSDLTVSTLLLADARAYQLLAAQGDVGKGKSFRRSSAYPDAYAVKSGHLH